jgi:hypothetical protein
MIAEMIAFAILGLILDGSEDFWRAVKEGDLPKVQSLLAASPSLAAVRTDKGVSAPLLALYHRKQEIAGLLLERKEAIEPLDVFEAAAFGRTERLKAIDFEPPSRMPTPRTASIPSVSRRSTDTRMERCCSWPEARTRISPPAIR